MTLVLLTVVFLMIVSRISDQQFEHVDPVKSVYGLQTHVEFVTQQIVANIWVGFLSVSLVAAIISFFVSSQITSRLQQLVLASQALAAGKSGQLVPVVSTDELGQLAFSFNSMNRELTNQLDELRQRELQMRERSEGLSTVLGGMVEGVIAVDSKEMILFANEAAFKMLEFDGRDVVGRPYWEVLRNTDVQKVFRDVVSGQFQLRREIVIPRSQARIAFIASKLPGDPCPGVVLVLHDVTALRRLENVRSEFVSNVSHELKTPLAAIQACTDTLVDGAIHDPEHAMNFLMQIADHSDRLHKLIIDLMELAKIESEEDVFDTEPIDIGVPIQEAIDEHVDVAKSHGVSLKYEATIEELVVRADQDGIRTIINNLLDNAIVYTASGGEVRVKWFQDQQSVVIQISDTGIGIEHQHQKRIFERFYRVDSARSREAGGTGLGLAIVKHLCQYFSGKISMNSEPNVGTTFVITFPLYDPTGPTTG